MRLFYYQYPVVGWFVYELQSGLLFKVAFGGLKTNFCLVYCW